MPKKTKKTKDLIPESTEPKLEAVPENKSEDPIGDETDGEAGNASAAVSEPEAASVADSEFTPSPRPPAKLERLQKILAQAGIASRRKAEEMIEQGRVQVNGKIVTVLGTKADAGRDHIRVDGKLLQGPERLRYFVLNKPRGFVTTVRDPEGRPTVMQFFDKMHERLYPVGRLDYMSEGLLLVTNDGELANRLTKASSGVEKTYLVKVAGQPTESELDILRGGVAIERGSAGPPQTGLRLRGAKPGSPQVRTSPARIRQVRQGDNPWYEVVLIEGRNRELRKMFESVGHFVEKIRRVGYGPLVLDQEPGNMRELEPKELDALRKTAEGKLRTPKSKEVRRRNAMDAAGLPTVAPRPTIHPRPAKPFTPRPFEARSAAAGDSRPRKFFAQDKTKPFRPARPASEGFRPAADRSSGRPAWKKDDRPTRRPARFAVGSTGEGRPAAGRPYRDKPVGRTYGDRPTTGRSFGARPASKSPAWKKPAASDRPANKRPAVPRRQAPVRDEDFGPVRPPNLQIEEIRQPDRINSARPNAFRSNSARPNSGKSFRREGGRPRAFTTSSGKPRAGGARPSSNPGVPTDRSSSVGQKSAGRTYGSGPSARPASGPRTGSRPFPGGERKTGTGWKPKTRYGGPNKPAFGVRSKPRPGSSTKSAFKGKPGSKRPGGAFSGKKRG